MSESRSKLTVKKTEDGSYYLENGDPASLGPEDEVELEKIASGLGLDCALVETETDPPGGGKSFLDALLVRSSKHRQDTEEKYQQVVRELRKHGYELA